VDAQALTILGRFGQAINGKSFQQDALVTHLGFQYLGYYDAQRQVCLGRRKLPAAAWEVIRFSDYDFKSNDAHNTISIGICPGDGTIHMAFDHHGDSLHYRVSAKNVATDPDNIVWNAGLFAPITDRVEGENSISITYPRSWQTPSGGLQPCYRRGGSGSGDRMLVDYNPKMGKWENTRQIDSHYGEFNDEMGLSLSRCSYPNGYTYDHRGRLHATLVWREESQGSNHDLIYVYSDDNGVSWRNNDSQMIEGFLNVNSPGSVVGQIGRGYGLMNTHGQTVDSKGRVHVIMWHCSDESLAEAGSQPGEERWGPPEARRYQHYWRGEDGTWEHFELPYVAGTRPKVFADKEDNLILIYSNKNLSSPGGDLLILGASATNDWEDWKTLYTHEGPFVNEMLADPYRWQSEQILSIMLQGAPINPHDSTPLRVLDFTFD